MKHQNLLYATLFVIVAVLVGMTILLQVAILHNQRATGTGADDRAAVDSKPSTNSRTTTQKTLLYRLREQIALALIPATATPPTLSSAPGVIPIDSVVTATATLTPIIIIVTPTVQSQAPTIAPPAEGTAILRASPTPALAGSTAPEPLTPAATADTVDYVVGYLAERPYCSLITEIVTLVLEQVYEQRVKKVAVATSDELYRALAYLGAEQEQIDLTFCTIFPNDMPYLQQYDDKLVPFGGAYMQIQGQRWHVLGYAGTQLPMRHTKPCLYQFLTTGILTLALEETQLAGSNASQWLVRAGARVSAATQCE